MCRQQGAVLLIFCVVLNLGLAQLNILKRLHLLGINPEEPYKSNQLNHTEVNLKNLPKFAGILEHIHSGIGSIAKPQQPSLQIDMTGSQIDLKIIRKSANNLPNTNREEAYLDNILKEFNPKGKVMLKALETASTYVNQIQTIFQNCIEIFENFLTVVLNGLENGKTVDDNKAFVEPKKIVNEFIIQSTSLIYITSDISENLKIVNKEITSIYRYLGYDKSIFDKIGTLLIRISKSYHELTIYDALIVNKIQTIIIPLNSTTDLIEVKHMSKYFLSPFKDIVKAILSIGSNCKKLGNRIIELVGVLKAYTIPM